MHREVAGLLVLVLGACCAGPVLASAPADDQAMLQRVEAYLDKAGSVQADFHQELLDAKGELRQQAEGHLAVARPGRFRWDYRGPAAQLLVSDGSTIWLYDEDLQQVTVRKTDQLAATPATLLAGTARVNDQFSVTAGGTAEGCDWAVLAAKQQDTDFPTVRLGFDGQVLRRMDLIDRLGQTTRIEFSNVVLNARLPADLFSFEPPPGVDVLGDAAEFR